MEQKVANARLFKPLLMRGLVRNQSFRNANSCGLAMVSMLGYEAFRTWAEVRLTESCLIISMASRGQRSHKPMARG